MNTQTQETLKIDLNKVRATIIERTYLDVNSAKLIDESIKATFEACKEALEQPSMTYEQGFAHGYEAHRVEQQETLFDEIAQSAQEPVTWGNPTYNYAVHHKVAPSWQGLSDDEITKFELKSLVGNPADWDVEPKRFARAIEQALKEKNHG